MLIVIISPNYSRETLAVPLIKSADLSDFDRYSLTQRLTGEVIRRGKLLGIPTPVNDIIYSILKPLALRAEQSK